MRVVGMVFLFFLSVFILGLCWGSFLNVVGYRLAAQKSLLISRSFCPSCNTVLAWYDIIPVLSWSFLRGKCRTCSQPISALYPFIELSTGFTFMALAYHLFPYGLDVFPTNILIERILSWFTYAVFFSSLIVGMRTDLQAMVVFQITTLWIIPLGLFASWYGLTALTLFESFAGGVLGYGFLWLVSTLFKRFTGKEGMGMGDFEIAALIGSFLGPLGVWFSVMLGSSVGFVVTLIYLYAARKERGTRIPFAPFLAMGALLYFFVEPIIVRLLLRW
jgi:leader peptidase (prepilin peptidase) / N-methyltransferase